MVFLTLLIIPVLVALGFLALGGKRVSLKEFLVHMAAMIAYTGICMGVIYWRNTADEEHINGVVTAKQMQRVSCRHPYCCAWCESCTTDSKGNTSCTTYCCGTCYDHPYDQDWNVWSNAGTKMWSIDTLDRQGLREPPRWSSTRIGEPVTWLHSYENYIKAAPGTLFKRDGLEDEKKFVLPERKLNWYDYWHTDQLVQVGITLPDVNEWNRGIERVNGHLGPRKEANLVVVIVGGQPREYFEALQAKWLGGKKNDVVVVIGVDGGIVQWADVMAWSYNEMVRVELRDSLVAMGQLNRQYVLELAQDNIDRNFQRKHMKDFKYLTASFAPTGTQYMVSILIGVVLSIGLGVVMVKYDLFNEDGGNTWERRERYSSGSRRSY